MFYYKVGNAPYCFPKNAREYFGENADISCYEEITESEYNELVAKQNQVNENAFEMESIKNWLSEHDYLINKHALGEIADNDKKWLDYLAERKNKLARYKELERK